MSNNVSEKSLTEGRIFIIDENFLFFVFLVWTFNGLLIIINSISIEFQALTKETFVFLRNTIDFQFIYYKCLD
ncbi:hypothetical protein CIB87_05190 [Priestia megaterium]|uniref:Uncharacterized protein n=1 Tax=Priestia megaterium TaxID=1404 RepID=A0AA86LSD5_PRIMG|nr:hypothetical protein CIB87_05190 [Priestia megaterium]